MLRIRGLKEQVEKWRIILTGDIREQAFELALKEAYGFYRCIFF